LPTCSGCAVKIHLIDPASPTGASYTASNAEIIWYSQEYTGGCPCALPVTQNPPGRLCPLPPACISSVMAGSWQLTGYVGATCFSPTLTKTTFYKAHVENTSNRAGCYTDFYGVVVVCDPPAKPVVSSPIITCPPVSVALTVTNLDPYPVPDCFEREYRLHNVTGGSYTPWVKRSLLPDPNNVSYTVTAFGNYLIEVKNACGTNVSDTIVVKPEDITADITGPCCICAGDPATFTVSPNNPGDTYLWSCSCMPVSSNTSSSVTITPAISPCILTLEVTNNGCTKTINKDIIICTY
jgi:hypothetical protein